MGVGSPVDYDRINRWGQWAPFTPTWSSTGTQPAIGNGVVRGRCRRDGSTGRVRWYIGVGTTTTFGTGEWRLSLPPDWSASGSDGETDWYQHGTGLCVPDATNAFDLVCWVLPGATTVRVIYPSGVDLVTGVLTSRQAQSVSATVPATWTASTVNFLSIGPVTLELADPTYP